MQINRIQSFQPKFQAQFSKDEETKKILKSYNNQYHLYETFWTISELNNIDSNDSISLKRLPKKNENGEVIHRVKNERTGAFVDVTSDARHNLVSVMGGLLCNPTTPEYKKLFGKSGLKKYGRLGADLDELSGANKINKEIAKLYLKNSDLETEIYRNTRKIRQLDAQELKVRLDYVQNLID